MLCVMFNPAAAAGAGPLMAPSLGATAQEERRSPAGMTAKNANVRSFTVAGARGLSRLHLCQDRDRIANLGNRHGGPICYEPDFNTHIDSLIFIVPVCLDRVDIDREFPRRGLYAYDLRSY